MNTIKNIANVVEMTTAMGESNHEMIKEFPFKSVLTFRYLIDFWKSEAENENSSRKELAKVVVEKIQHAKELNDSIDDLKILEKYRDIIDLMMTAVYPPSQWDRLISTSHAPFQPLSFYSTNLYKKLLSFDESTTVNSMNINTDSAIFNKVISAYFIIFYFIYGIKLKVDIPFMLKIIDKETNIYRYFKLNIDPKFVRVVAVKDKPDLSENEKQQILNDPLNLKLWMKLLPPDIFQFHGFVTLTAVNVTDQEIISSLKHDLLEKESIISMVRFQNLEEKMKSLFRIPKLRLGLAAVPKDWTLMRDYGRKIGDSFILNESCKINCSEMDNSIYDKAYKQKEPILINNIEDCETITSVEREILKQGIKNILIAPLYHKDELIGVFELGSPNPGDINQLNAIKVKSILALFATAVKRSMDELESEVQAVIKEKCTAIHPSVEWRFRKAAVNIIMNKNSEMEEIVFKNVYPLYALSDIRNSSDHRNAAIQNDLVEHLVKLKEILNTAKKFQPLSIFSEMNFRIEKYIKKIKSSLNSGDEVSVLDFIHYEIEPVFKHLSSYDKSVSEMIDKYFGSLDPNMKIFYSMRKDYEESVATINETISNILDEAQLEAQGIFPHYFEKYKTDGVEHGIYIGGSLVEDKKFDLLYLKNLRLWQLMTVCAIAKKTAAIKSELKIPLETSHLVLVQDNPLSIRFRQDEKKFDVDGTYNLRYEIMKKRIDKAVIKGTNERLTQPGKLAVIYSQSKEAQEYRRYFEYLFGIDYLKGKVEDYELEDLQGVHGLRALRADVNLNGEIRKNAGSKEISETVEKLGVLN